jgi:pimeloyl-ACP methyl ester carboxylesterase
MAASTQRTVRTPDGRTLAVEEAGDPGGRPVLVHNGTPNSRHLCGPAADDAAARGLRLIGYDRPGYGGSTPRPGRTVADCASDVRADLSELLKTLLTPTDAATLTGEFAEYLVYTGREGLAPGSPGWWDDGVAHGGRWGFELSDIRIPVLLMHGRQDQFVPFGHGQWLAARIPGVDARLLDDDGHLTLETNRVGEVHAWLADRL